MGCISAIEHWDWMEEEEGRGLDVTLEGVCRTRSILGANASCSTPFPFDFLCVCVCLQHHTFLPFLVSVCVCVGVYERVRYGDQVGAVGKGRTMGGGILISTFWGRHVTR